MTGPSASPSASLCTCLSVSLCPVTSNSFRGADHRFPGCFAAVLIQWCGQNNSDFLIPSAVNLRSLLLYPSIFNLTLPLQLFQSPLPPRACLREHVPARVSALVCSCACVLCCGRASGRGALVPPCWAGVFLCHPGQAQFSQHLVVRACIPETAPRSSVSVRPHSPAHLGMLGPPPMGFLLGSKRVHPWACVTSLLWSTCLLCHSLPIPWVSVGCECTRVSVFVCMHTLLLGPGVSPPGPGIFRACLSVSVLACCVLVAGPYQGPWLVSNLCGLRVQLWYSQSCSVVACPEPHAASVPVSSMLPALPLLFMGCSKLVPGQAFSPPS